MSEVTRRLPGGFDRMKLFTEKIKMKMNIVDVTTILIILDIILTTPRSPTTN